MCLFWKLKILAASEITFSLKHYNFLNKVEIAWKIEQSVLVSNVTKYNQTCTTLKATPDIAEYKSGEPYLKIQRS